MGPFRLLVSPAGVLGSGTLRVDRSDPVTSPTVGVFSTAHNLRYDGFSYELSDGNRVSLQVDGTKVATVQKVRMDERDWERFLEVLGATQEPNPSAFKYRCTTGPGNYQPAAGRFGSRDPAVRIELAPGCGIGILWNRNNPF